MSFRDINAPMKSKYLIAEIFRRHCSNIIQKITILSAVIFNAPQVLLLCRLYLKTRTLIKP